jgi:thiol-disulfide isomerase/thioredoxin
MIKRAFLTTAVIIQTGFCYCQTGKEILNKTIASLNSIKTVEYSTSFYQTNNGMADTKTAVCYLDLTSEDTLYGAKYHLIIESNEMVFDGKRYFSTWNDKKLVILKDNPNKEFIGNSSALMNSLYNWKRLLPKIISDTSITITRQNDTIVSNKDCYKIHISILGRYIDIISPKLISKETNEKSDYFLSVSKENYIPVQSKYLFPVESDGAKATNINTKFNVKHLFPVEPGHSKTTYENVNLHAERKDSIWNYDRFPDDFTRISYDVFYSKSYREKNLNAMLNISAPNWVLPMIGGDSVRFSKLKGKPVLLEFWFPYCGGCVASIPDVNEIAAKYRKKGLKVYGIEFTKEDGKGLQEYIDKNKIKYPTLYKGKNAATDYKANAAPTFVLIDKKGTIVYMKTGMNKSDLIVAIDKLR